MHYIHRMEANQVFFALNPDNQMVEIRPSTIHGLGLFSKKDIKKGYILGPAMIDRSIARYYLNNTSENYDQTGVDDDWVQCIGTRYLNHSNQPNIGFQFEDKFIIAIAIKDIVLGDEITVNYLDYFSHTYVPLPRFLS